MTPNRRAISAGGQRFLQLTEQRLRQPITIIRTFPQVYGHVLDGLLNED